MTSATVPAALRRAVSARAGGACEYCLLHEDDAFFPHEPDHVIALKHSGATTIENLALVRRAALSILKRDTKVKHGVKL